MTITKSGAEAIVKERIPDPTGILKELRETGFSDVALPSDPTPSDLLIWMSRLPFHDLSRDLCAVLIIEETFPAVRRARLSGPHLSGLSEALKHTSHSCRELADRVAVNAIEDAPLHHDAVARVARGEGFTSIRHALVLAEELFVSIADLMTREEALAYVSLDNLRVHNLRKPASASESHSHPPDRQGGLFDRISRGLRGLFQ